MKRHTEQTSSGSGIHVVHFQRKPFDQSFSIEHVYASVRARLPDDINADVVVSGAYSKGVLPRLRSAWAAREHSGEVNHITGDVHYLAYFLNKRRTILTIHDTVVLERAKGLRRFLLWLFWFWLPEKRCTRIVAVSEETKRRILAQLHCDPAKIEVIHNPVADEFQAVPYEFNRARPRVLQMGTKENKNVERLIEALQGLDVVLVVIGSLTERQSRLLERCRIAFESRSNLTNEEVRREYEAADLVTFVSTDEGFGLPIVEAQAVGRPVVTSDKDPMKEVAGEGAVLVDPYSVGAIRHGVSRVLHEPDLRARLIDAGFRNVERFRVETVARAYADLYRAVAEAARH